MLVRLSIIVVCIRLMELYGLVLREERMSIFSRVDIWVYSVTFSAERIVSTTRSGYIEMYQRQR